MYTPCGKALKYDPPPLLIASADFNLEWPETVHARTVEWRFVGLKRAGVDLPF